VRTIQEGEHAILKNRHHKYAVLKVLDVKDRTRLDAVDELTFEFRILTDTTKTEHRANREKRPSGSKIREQVEEAEVRRGAEQAAEPQKTEKPLKHGTVFRDKDEPWCPEMVVIPPGEFMMGSTEAERQWAVEEGTKQERMEPEKPQHLVRIDYSLVVGRYPVTFEEYGQFASSTGRAQPHDEGWGRSTRPAINVDWEDAKSFAAWLSVQTDQPYRLLSEAEWEYACRAGTTSRYWWGDQITPENANYGVDAGKTSEVGKYPANPFGLYDMHGNVWEWVEDCWHDSYVGAPDDGSAWTAGSGSRRVLRGGCWSNYVPGVLRCAFRDWDTSDRRSNVHGFRVARTLSRTENVTS
jgi:formylglycine-generating enzyme required for sulfatase activity